MSEHEIRIPVDPANPGQFFACCGLFELAHRTWRGIEASFASREFVLRSDDDRTNSLAEVLDTFKKAQASVSSTTPDGEDAESDRREDDKAEPMVLADPFNLRLDWWSDKSLKPWAGSMNARLIFAAMAQAIDEESADPFGDCRVVYEATGEAPESDNSRRRSKGKKREPFYFDARRGASAKAVDTGFAPDALSMTTAACPAAEALCLVGLQRFRPMPTDSPRVFDYCTWHMPLPVALAAVAACGLLPGVAVARYRFENAFRTDQRKHKGFMPASRIGDE